MTPVVGPDVRCCTLTPSVFTGPSFFSRLWRKRWIPNMDVLVLRVQIFFALLLSCGRSWLWILPDHKRERTLFFFVFSFVLCFYSAKDALWVAGKGELRFQPAILVGDGARGKKLQARYPLGPTQAGIVFVQWLIIESMPFSSMDLCLNLGPLFANYVTWSPPQSPELFPHL